MCVLHIIKNRFAHNQTFFPRFECNYYRNFIIFPSLYLFDSKLNQKYCVGIYIAKIMTKTSIL